MKFEKFVKLVAKDLSDILEFWIVLLLLCNSLLNNTDIRQTNLYKCSNYISRKIFTLE